MNDSEFDRLIKAKLERHEAEVPEFLWNAIATHIPQKRISPFILGSSNYRRPVFRYFDIAGKRKQTATAGDTSPCGTDKAGTIQLAADYFRTSYPGISGKQHKHDATFRRNGEYAIPNGSRHFGGIYRPYPRLADRTCREPYRPHSRSSGFGRNGKKENVDGRSADRHTEE